ncbi:MAG: 30S ribosomal protein S17 [Candidatus Moranbacteria bacterium GW2011_GWF2_34_56]|nr:MAG: 30S ribosomal protein S17 [Candidatus Moranbacteria bacterium GW2011_GWF1_34_10]KKP65246.1 MAG: 30S ribosomal protein S17 [Candidatus Moranbacteria bacterium GW2011_GWF2_34_56]HBI17499.1 30S ribosomal protein S17 [Candidatus Moranbacteria bacterium]
MTEKKVEKLNKLIKGVVVSDKMDKTIVVSVETFETHPKYLKKYRSTKKYHVHDAENKYKVGDRVEFFSTKPISKSKTFQVL